MAKEVYAGGLTLDFFVEKGFESLDNLTGDDRVRANARNFVRLLMLEQVIGWQQALNLDTVKFAFYDATAIQRKYMFEVLQEGLSYIGYQLQHQTLNEQQQRQASILIASVLSYVPFSYPEKESVIEIPQLVNEQWKMVSCQINPIDLTASYKNIPYVFNDDDRVWAYGLSPQGNDKDASPWLVYQGTTYPSGNGFMTQLMTDMKPFKTVGHDLYMSGKAEIERWFDQFPNRKINVTGVSLGGALSLLTACNLGDRCSHVYALNPAGLVENSSLKKIDLWDSLVTKPAVFVIKQGADPVSIMGTWKPDWIILRGELDKECPNFLTHHFVNFARSSHTRFIKEPHDHDKSMRTINNIILYTGLRAIGYTFFLLPWRYLVIPLYRLAKAVVLTTCCLLAALVCEMVSLVNLLLKAIVNGTALLMDGVRKLTEKSIERVSACLDDFNQSDQQDDTVTLGPK
ncbi:hypothetical protein [Legionella sp. W05-934-2]|jgi:pimeloyl-ACP methyl ester carboxylesterase|uniref:lipase family protein n=1 Tax=Legionella sp. W05-934-2 TaxID=1198649 RepID=UPI00346298A4